jgi:arsenate reductase (thioredoxin)
MTTKVLFLCTGNSARSQMAEALLRKHGGERFAVFSAGLEPHAINPLTIRVMEEQGVDMSAHRSKSVEEYLGKASFDYVITVCAKVDKNCPIFPGVTTRLHWPFDDPAAVTGTDAERLAAFRRVRNEIEAKIRSWLAEQDARSASTGSKTKA